MRKSDIKIEGIKDPYRDAATKGWDIIDASALTENTHLQVDVVIVGSGSGGGTAAEILSAAGLRCLIIEEGRLKSSDEFNMNEREGFELYQEGGLKRTKDGAVLTAQGRSVGGGTTVNWCSSFRTPAQTLDYWQSQFGLRACSPQAMAPEFERMEKRLNVSKWAAPANENNQILKRGATALGYSWGHIPRNVAGCWDLGYCGVGCPVDAKQSMLVTTIPASLAQGSTLVYRAEVDTVDHDDARVVGVTAYAKNADGSRRTGVTINVKARHTVLAAGAINTPGILLRSEVPDPHKRIGKRTFIHPVTSSFAKFGHTVDAFYGAPQTIYSDQFNWSGEVDGPIGYKLEVMPLLPGTFSVVFGGHGEAVAADIKDLPNIHGMLALLRDGFHRDSCGGEVELTDDGTAILDYPLNSFLRDGVRRSLKSMTEIQFAAGAKSVKVAHTDSRWHQSVQTAHDEIDQLLLSPGKIGLSSAHIMGGCLMGDGDVSVVDQRGQFRFLDNLSIFDGSLFPTSIGANPQLSIFAFSSKFSRQLAHRLVST